MISAKQLRNKANLKNIPEKVGLYKWYANEQITKKLLGDYFDGIKPHLTS